MRCRYCGNEIPDHLLRCDKCGRDVRFVPDYNPLDDMLSEHIKGSINGYDSGKIAINSTKPPQKSRNTDTSRRRQSDNRSAISERERKKRQIARKKALRRKRRRLVLTILLVLIIILTGVTVGLYRISYSGLVSRGNNALEAGDYTTASDLFNTAIEKNKKKADAYDGLADVALAKDNKDDAENVYLNVISEQPDNADLYKACIQYYLKVEQQDKIPGLIESAPDSVQNTLAEYTIVKPSYSLDDNETYDEVQQLSLTTDDGCTIYYTIDGKDPTTSSKKYSEPLLLEEGETVVKSISVNDETGIPSTVASKTYTIELPIEDAPAVSPSTGQYTSENQIEIVVPEGYTAYYTLDESDPTTASTKYTDPIDMPEGETIFKAVLIDSAGRASGITTRNYVLDLN